MFEDLQPSLRAVVAQIAGHGLAGITAATSGELDAIVKRYHAAGERVVEGTF
jgi:hypothetical protein